MTSSVRKVTDTYKFTRTYRRLVENTTINSETLLSTDYLNHFNELVMMIDLVPDMPEMFEDAKAWSPRTYQEHFEDSAFTHKDLAIAAYDQVLDADRTALERTVNIINHRVVAGFKEIGESVENGDMDKLRVQCTSVTTDLGKLIDRCSGIINGVRGVATQAVKEAEPVLEQDLVDGTTVEVANEPEEVVMNQNAIDALFD